MKFNRALWTLTERMAQLKGVNAAGFEMEDALMDSDAALEKAGLR